MSEQEVLELLKLLATFGEEHERMNHTHVDLITNAITNLMENM